MDPHIWGRGAWLVLFTVIYKFLNRQFIVTNYTNKQYIQDIEELKRFIYIFCSNLPCNQCATNALTNIKENSIMSVNDPNVILHFFSELYNSFHVDKIDRTQLTVYSVYIDDFNKK